MKTLHYSPNLGKLAKCSNPEKCPYGHWIEENMKRMNPVLASNRIQVMKNSYAALNISPTVIAPALNQLRSAMTDDLFTHVSAMKAQRDGEEKYHLTVLSPKEFREFKKAKLELPEKAFDFEVLGVGTAANEKSQTWFAVAKSASIDEWRASLGLGSHHLHVTLGFTVTDVHGVDKSSRTLL